MISLLHQQIQWSSSGDRNNVGTKSKEPLVVCEMYSYQRNLLNLKNAIIVLFKVTQKLDNKDLLVTDPTHANSTTKDNQPLASPPT